MQIIGQKLKVAKIESCQNFQRKLPISSSFDEKSSKMGCKVT